MKRETPRLWLEPFDLRHLDELAEINADPNVMRYLSNSQTRAETKAGILRVAERWKSLGYGWWALVAKTDGAVVGAACLQNVENKLDNPLEIGWRLHPSAQGKGYATEAGQAAMDFAFEVVKTNRIIAIANPKNTASINVMKRLGMTDIGLSNYYDETCATYEMLRPI